MPKISSLHATKISALHIGIERRDDGTYEYSVNANPLMAHNASGPMQDYSRGGPVRSIQAVLAEIITQLNSPS